MPFVEPSHCPYTMGGKSDGEQSEANYAAKGYVQLMQACQAQGKTFHYLI